jgi:hypothetical protein
LIKSKTVRNPLEVQYFAAALSLFGKDRVMKFSADPCGGEKTQNPFNPGEVPPDDYLHEALVSTVSQGKSVCFDLKIQVNTIDQVKSDRQKADPKDGDLIKGSAGRSSLKPVPTGFSSRQGTTLPCGRPAPSCVRQGTILRCARIVPWLPQ